MGHLYWIVVLLCLCACAQDTVVIVSVAKRSQEVKSLQVTAIHSGKSESQDFRQNLDSFAIRLPPGTEGPLTIKVEGRIVQDQGAQPCTVMVGQQEVPQLVPSGITSVSVELAPVPLAVNSISPQNGPTSGGTNITISGTGFVAESEVLVNGTAVRQLEVVSACQIKALVPRNPGALGKASVKVSRPDGQMTLVADGFSYYLSQMTFAQNLNYNFPTGGGPVKIVMADMNKDLRMDLITLNLNDKTVSVLLGNGNGTFLPPMDFPTADGSACMAVGDLNTDGNPDLAVFTKEAIVSLLLGKGDGTFFAKNDFPSPPSVGPALAFNPDAPQAGCIAMEEVNGDGRLDLILNGQLGLGVLLSQGNIFPPNQFNFIRSSRGGTVATGRLLFGSNALSLVVCTALGCDVLSDVARNGTFLSRFDLNVVDSVDDLLAPLIPAIDNGRAFILKSYSSKVSVLSGLQRQDRIDYPTGNDPVSIVSGDFTGDGSQDLAIAHGPSNGVTLWQGGTFALSQIISAGQYPISLASGDVNGDGRLDLAVANFRDNSVNVILSPQPDFQKSLPGSVAIRDVNGDKNLDLVVINGNKRDTISLFLGNGDGFFQKGLDIQTGSSPFDVEIGDLNRDDRMDLAVINYNNNTVSVILAATDGTFLPRQDFQTGPYPIGIVMGDINMDGRLDLVVANAGNVVENTDNSVSVLLNKGNGIFFPKQDFPTDWSPTSIALGDLNEDGRLDLVVASNKKNAVSVMLGKGNGTFQQRQFFSLPNMASIEKLRIAHADSDLHLDVIALDGKRGVIYTMLGSGDNDLIRKTISSAPLGGVFFNDMKIKDIDGDGYNDVMVCYNANISKESLLYFGSVAIMIGNGNGNFVNSVDVRTKNPPYKLETGDLNKDGTIDLVTYSSDGIGILFNTSR